MNSTRIKVTTECCDRLDVLKKVNFLYNNKRETYNVCVGIPVLATKNIKDEEIFNTMQFKIDDIDDRTFKINNIWFDEKEFAENFVPSFCVTVLITSTKVLTSTSIIMFAT